MNGKASVAAIILVALVFSGLAAYVQFYANPARAFVKNYSTTYTVHGVVEIYVNGELVLTAHNDITSDGLKHARNLLADGGGGASDAVNDLKVRYEDVNSGQIKYLTKDDASVSDIQMDYDGDGSSDPGWQVEWEWNITGSWDIEYAHLMWGGASGGTDFATYDIDPDIPLENGDKFKLIWKIYVCGSKDMDTGTGDDFVAYAGAVHLRDMLKTGNGEAVTDILIYKASYATYAKAENLSPSKDDSNPNSPKYTVSHTFTINDDLTASNDRIRGSWLDWDGSVTASSSATDFFADYDFRDDGSDGDLPLLPGDTLTITWTITITRS